MSAPASDAAPDLSRRFMWIMQTLQQMIAAHAGRHRAASPIVLLVCPYLARLARRFHSLMQRVQSGRLPTRGTDAAQAPPRRATAQPPPLQPHPPTLGLPRTFAWLIRLAPQTGQLGTMMRMFLTEPECVALLEAAPQAGRLLRPLCRAMGIGPAPDLPAALFPARPPRKPPAPGVPQPHISQPCGPDLPDPPAARPSWPLRPQARPPRHGPTDGLTLDPGTPRAKPA